MLRQEAGTLEPTATGTPAGAAAAAASQRKRGTGLFGSSKSKPLPLDVALEANQKLQLVAEDTLVKNIRLQECVDVLGREVAELREKLGGQQS